MSSRVIRSAFVLVILAIPPWLLTAIPDLVSFDDVSNGSLIVREGWQTLRGGRLPVPELIVLTVAIVWLSWLRICFGFLWALGRVLLRRPIHHHRRCSAKLALWALMISPTVALSVWPSSVQAVGESLETTERDFQNKPLSVPQVLVSVVVASGVLFRLRTRRKELLRQGLSSPPEASVHWETAIDREEDELIIVRIELAVRSLIGLQATSFRMILRETAGAILVEFPHERLARSPWVHHAPRIWRLEAAISLQDLAYLSRSQTLPIPLLLPVGCTAAGEVWVNLQEVGVFGIHGQGIGAEHVWQGMCQSLALSPFSEHVSFISVEEQGLRGRREIVVPDEEHADLLAQQLHSDETPVVILGRNRRSQSSPAAILHRQRPIHEEFGLSQDQDRWLLHPTMTVIEPHRCNREDLDVLDVLVPTPSAMTLAVASHESHNRDPVQELLPPHSFIASILGTPHVRHVSGATVAFERRRSEELVIWLSLHPTSQRRSSARAEMWSVAIKDATFSNITSDVRRSLTVLERPPQGEEWLGVTLTDEMPLHTGVVSDAYLLAWCLDHARKRPEEMAVEILEYGLSLVSGVPFSGSSYLWRDTTGLSSEYAMLVVRTALFLADMYVEQSERTGISQQVGIYRATAKGLLAIPGHEDLVIRRMELHARHGDQAALCAEWQGYCRALASDDWGDVDPSPKMVEVWRDLSHGRR